MNSEMYEEFEVRYGLLQDLSKQYWSDAALRDRIDGGDSSLVRERLDFSAVPGAEVRVLANTSDVYHVIMPPDPNYPLSDEALERVMGGAAPTVGSASSISSAGSVGTSTAPSTLSSTGTASTFALREY